MKCEYCKKELKSLSTLNTHIKKSKKCMETRNIVLILEFKCDGCNYNSSKKSNLIRHQEKCLEYKNKIIEDNNKIIENKIKLLYENKITELKNIIIEKDKTISEKNNIIKQKDKTIKELFEKSLERTTNTTNTINTTNSNNTTIENNIKINMLPYETLTDKDIKYAFVNEFGEEFFLQGQKGLAQFVSERLLKVIDKDGNHKKLMACTDSSRKIFKTLDKNGEVSKDVEAKKLTERIYEPVKVRSDLITKEIGDKYFYLVENTSDELENDDDEKVDLNIASEKLTKALDSKTEIYKLIKDNTEFSKELSKILS